MARYQRGSRNALGTAFRPVNYIVAQLDFYYDGDMPTELSNEQTAVNRINALLPALVHTLNHDPRLPWAHSLTVDELRVSRIPVYFVTSDAAHVASSKAARKATGHVAKAGLIGSHLIVTQLPADESDSLIADLTFHNKEEDTLGIASIEFNDAGELTKLNDAAFYKDGEPLKRGTTAYNATLLTLLMMNASDPGDGSGEPASGVERTVIDGVDVYSFRHGFDSDVEHREVPIQYSPRIMPRMRDELAKEFKHFNTRPGSNLEKTTVNYLKEIGESLETSTELWWVSEDMSKLAWDVAISGTEPEDLNDRILPAPSGLMWLNGGGGPALLTKRDPDSQFFETGDTESELLSINAIAWYTPSQKSAGIPGLEVGVPRFMGLTASPALARDSTQWDGMISPLDLESNLVDYFRIPTYVTFFKLKFLPRKLALIVMRLAREETLGETRSETVGGSAGGHGKKRAKNKKIETITCALLRSRQYASEWEREAEAREYSHRWIVRGHMRNQPVGPRNAIGGQRHERVWIAPYVKGPEDKPLVLKDRVQVWR